MQNEWRMPDSSPYFLVSFNGEVKTSDTGRMIKAGNNGNGYFQVQVMRKGKRYTRYVHRLVAECFVPNPNGYKEINHIDGNKANNSAENLEWCTHSENMYHSFRTGLRPMTTPKQQEAARKNSLNSRDAMRRGWKEWSKTERAKMCWIRNLENADRWGTKKAKEEQK